MVDTTALEMRHTRKGIGGSNPSLSASMQRVGPGMEIFQVSVKTGAGIPALHRFLTPRTTQVRASQAV